MRLTCPNCGAEYDVPEGLIPPAGKHVQCTACHTRWFMRGQAREELSEDQILRKLETRTTRPIAGTPGATPIPFPGMTAATPEPLAEPEPETPAEPPEETAPFDWQSPDGVLDDTAAESEPEDAAAAGPMSLRPAAPPPVVPEAPARAPGSAPEVSAEAARVPQEHAVPRIGLREAPRAPQRISIADSPAARPVPSRARRRFLPGFILVLLIAGLAFEVYVWRDPLAAQMPAAAPAITGYADAVDAAREWLRDRVDQARGTQPQG
jgi:predicted Zn finger-like uncharacterized protein